MPRVARLGDQISHGGPIITASPNVRVNSIRVARLGDRVNCARHGIQTIVGASATVKANSIGVARFGDPISCGAVIAEASPNVIAGG